MKFFQLIPSDTKIDFISKFRYFMVFSVVTGILVIAGVVTKGLNYGVDFTGGTVANVRFNSSRTAEEVRKMMGELGEQDASVVSADKDGHDYLLTTRSHHEIKDQVPLQKKLTDKVGADIKINSVDVVGPKVGAELKLAALQSLVYTIILIMIYIWFRFDFRFAPGATIAMVHDLLMATGFYFISGQEFTITAIAALLTIAGYSVNDTIIVYDRVRELFKIGGDGLPLPETINHAVNLTLSRTILTSGVTLISVVPIAMLCTGEIRDFAIAMIFGIFVGTYSTIYIASPFTIYVDQWMKNRDPKSKKGGRAKAVTA